MMAQKTKDDVAGYAYKCPDYEQCPLCYGCRNYNEKYLLCVELCGEDMKKNVCNTQRHKDNLIAKMITRETIEI